LKLAAFVRSLVETETVPGICILVGQKGDILHSSRHGFRSLLPAREPLEQGAIYDLASITKPLVTAFLTVHLKEKAGLDLHSPVTSLFPEFPWPITWMHLLTHTSGLPAWHPFYLFTREDFPDIGQFSRLHPLYPPGKTVVYSCVGYMLLRLLIEKVTGQEFKKTAQDVIFDRLGLENTFLSVPAARVAQTAPTERGNVHERQMCRRQFGLQADAFTWRETIIRGQVHDANSFYFGGCAGNAGLFSTAEDLFSLSKEFFPETATILSPECIRLFWTDFGGTGLSRRTVGFKRNSAFLSSGGRALSRQSIGHNGFTGTSIWLEPRSQMAWILLSNRIHPVVQPVSFNRIRRKIHHLLRRELGH